MEHKISLINKQRNTNIELLRLLSMILIVIHHICGQGIGFQFYCTGGEKIDSVDNWFPVIYTEAFCIVGVNIFLLISGYFGIRLRIKAIIKYLSVVLAFVIIHSVCESFYNDGITLKHVVRTILFFYSENTAWFVKCYFILMLFSFIINKTLEKSTRKQLVTMLAIVLFVNVYLGFFKHWPINENGYTVSQMIMMYVIGHSINAFQIQTKIQRKYFLFGYLLLSLLLGTLMCLGLDRINGKVMFWILSYNNPVIILSSVMLFCFFASFNLKNKIVNSLLSGVFGIYLFHQYRPFWTYVMIPSIREHYIQMSLESFMLYCSGLILLIITVGITVNLLILNIVNKIINRDGVNQKLFIIDNKLSL